LAGALEPVDLTVYDHLFEWRGPRRPTLPVVIVTIDESTFGELNEPWPFPRAMHGQVLRAIAAGRPIAIGVDIIFDAPSLRGPADDEALGAAIGEAGNVLLAAAITEDVQPFYTRTTLTVPIAAVRQGAVRVAPVNIPPDADGHVRRAPVWLALERQRLPAFDVPVSFWAGKIVLVGPTSEILHDQFATAFARGGDMPGVEIHAHALETLVRGDAIREVPVLVSAIATVVAGLIVGALVAWLPGRAVEGTAGVLTLMVVATYVAFAYGDVWFRATGSGLALAVGLVLSIVARGLPPAPSA